MIKKTVLDNALYTTITKASCCIPDDVRSAFVRAIERETSPRSREAFEKTLQSLDLSKEKGNLACADTGWPLFFFKVGRDAWIEDGLPSLERSAKEMTARATKEGFLRSTMKHPLTGEDPGTNVGENIPGFTYSFVPGDSVQVSFAAKGGGSEIFGGTQYRMVAFADGLAGVKKFVLDSYAASARAGAVCPPAVLGVGIGGTANIAANLAKEAACLRLIGSSHPEKQIRSIEEDLYRAINTLGIGAMGTGGDVSVFAVHVEYAYTHIGGVAVATSTNCWIARRATTTIFADGRTEQLEAPMWFGGR